MNSVILSGRLTADPEIHWTQKSDGSQFCVARYRLAVDHRYKNEKTAYFFTCVALGRNGEFVQKYLTRGMKVMVQGELQSSTFTKKDGGNGYAVEVLVQNHEFAESKGAQALEGTSPRQTYVDDFVTIPDDVSDENLPFN